MKRVAKILAYFALFFLCLGMFLYFMFPYNILKESMIAKVSESTGMSISAGDLSPKISIGFDLEDIEISFPGITNRLKIEEVSVNTSILYLLTGRLRLVVGVEKGEDGYLDASLNIPILSLIKQQVSISDLNIEARKFAIDDIVAFFLEKTAKSPTANPMLAGMLDKILFTGDLHANINLDVDTNQIKNSSGKLNIELKNGMLKLNDPSMEIEDQNFTKAKISGDVQNGRLVLSNTSGINSTGLDVGIEGKLMLSNNIGASNLDFTLPIKLKEKLKEQFGFWIDAFTGKTSGGELSVQVRGRINSPNVTTI